MQITDKMVKELNAELKMQGCAFKYVINKAFYGNTVIERVPISDKYIKTSIINCTDEFYVFLDNFFKERGINRLGYNNTGNMCWSLDGFPQKS